MISDIKKIRVNLTRFSGFSAQGKNKDLVFRGLIRIRFSFESRIRFSFESRIRII